MGSRLIKITTPVARVEHTCYHCGKVIAKGEKYLNHTYVTNGKIDRHYLHLICRDEKLHPQETKVIRPVGPQFHPTPATEAQFRQIVKDDTKEMIEAFSFKENMKIALLPLIITEMAWSYTDKVLAYCAENKLSATVKLSRTVKGVRQAYLSDLYKDLSKKHVGQIISESQRFMQECSQTFFILRLQIGLCIKNQWANTSDTKMVTDAQLALLMLGLLDKNEEQVKKLILKRTGNYYHVANPRTDALRKSLKAYNKYDVIYNEHVKNCIKIIEKKINQIDFNVV